MDKNEVYKQQTQWCRILHSRHKQRGEHIKGVSALSVCSTPGPAVGLLLDGYDRLWATLALLLLAREPAVKEGEVITYKELKGTRICLNLYVLTALFLFLLNNLQKWLKLLDRREDITPSTFTTCGHHTTNIAKFLTATWPGILKLIIIFCREKKNLHLTFSFIYMLHGFILDGGETKQTKLEPPRKRSYCFGKFYILVVSSEVVSANCCVKVWLLHIRRDKTKAKSQQALFSFIPDLGCNPGFLDGEDSDKLHYCSQQVLDAVNEVLILISAPVVSVPPRVLVLL